MPVIFNIVTNLSAVWGSSIKRKIAISLASAGMIATLATPSAAHAGGSLHIDIPGISIGVHDSHHGKKRYRRVYRDRHYYDDRKSRRHERRRYYKKRYYNNRNNNHRYYNWRDDDNYYSRRSNRSRDQYRRYDNRRSEICPRAGYSPYYNDNRNCYRHKGHFHCS